MEFYTNFQTLRAQISSSNLRASINRNKYPIQEQATLIEVWECVPCECNRGCTCRKFKCTSHWKLQKSLTFNTLLKPYLRMFVDKSLHQRILGWIEGTLDKSDTITPRARKLLPTLERLKVNWVKLYSGALNHGKTLICDDWYTNFLRAQWNFSVRKESVHQAKQFCILLPDICVPYDTQSRPKILKFLQRPVRTYFEMLDQLREKVIAILESENQSLSAFRRLDSPQEQLDYDPDSILLRTDDVNYGTSYTPAERPLSRVIDKIFYQPRAKGTIS